MVIGCADETKIEISTNAGSSYSNWTDLAGNYFVNYDYSSGKIVPFITWSTTRPSLRRRWQHRRAADG